MLLISCVDVLIDYCRIVELDHVRREVADLCVSVPDVEMEERDFRVCLSRDENVE